MKNAIAKASLAVMGIFAYLILSIVFYQNAMAAPLGQQEELEADQLGFQHILYEDDGEHSRAIVNVSIVIKTAVYSKAWTECTDPQGAVAGDCVMNRSAQIMDTLSAVVKEREGNARNADMVKVFFDYAIFSEWDRVTPMAFAATAFVQQIMGAKEPRS